MPPGGQAPPAQAAAADQQQHIAHTTRFSDPAGLFQLDVPAGWQQVNVLPGSGGAFCQGPAGTVSAHTHTNSLPPAAGRGLPDQLSQPHRWHTCSAAQASAAALCTARHQVIRHFFAGILASWYDPDRRGSHTVAVYSAETDASSTDDLGSPQASRPTAAPAGGAPDHAIDCSAAAFACNQQL